jgi:hypothetical protein
MFLFISPEAQDSTGAASSASISVNLNAPRRAAASMQQLLQQPQQQQEQQQQPCTTQTTYISSAFEQAWLDNVANWQDDFCNVTKSAQQQQWTRIWLDTLAAETAGKQAVQYDPAVFSRSVTTRTCPCQQQPEEITTWIEPLAHGLRHPHALCNMGADIFDRGYLLVANQQDALALRAQAAFPGNGEPCRNRSCQAIYMDLGATRWEAHPNSVGQAWFYRWVGCWADTAAVTATCQACGTDGFLPAPGASSRDSISSRVTCFAACRRYQQACRSMLNLICLQDGFRQQLLIVSSTSTCRNTELGFTCLPVGCPMLLQEL